MTRSINGADTIPDLLSSHTAQLATKANQSDINTTNQNVAANASKIGDITQLNTTDKSSVVNALKEIKSQANSNANSISTIGNASPKGAFSSLSALQSAYPSGTTGVYVVTADGNWYYWNGTAWTAGGVYQSTGIPDGSITTQKTAFIGADKQNLLSFSTSSFDSQVITQGTTGASLSYGNNAVTLTSTSGNASNTFYSMTGLTVGNTYSINVSWSGNLNWLRLFKGDKTTVLSTLVTGTDYTFTATDSTMYLGISMLGAMTATVSNPVCVAGTNTTIKYALNKANLPSIYETDLPTDFTLNGSKIVDKSLLEDKLQIAARGKNLFNKARITTGYYVYTGGQIVADSTMCYSDYIRINPNTQYALNIARSYAFYDANKVFISGDQVSPFTTPSNAAYIRISAKLTEIDATTQLEQGSTSTSYMPYYYTLTNLRMLTNWSGKKWGTLGDSMTDQKLYQPYVVTKLGLSTYLDYGVPGTRVSDGTGSDTTAMCRDERINAIDSTCDFITVLGGHNDWSQSVTLGTVNDTVTNTFYGAYKTMLEKLISRFPNQRIVTMTPPYGMNTNNFPSTNGLINNQNLTLKDYGDVVKEVSRLYGFPCIDIYGNAGWNKLTNNSYTLDGVHPNDSGHQRIAALIVGQLKAIDPIS